MKTLFEWIFREGNWCKTSDEMRVAIQKNVWRKKVEFLVHIEGPLRDIQMQPGTPMAYIHRCRDRIKSGRFPATEDGLLQAIVFLKKCIHKYRTEGTCEACEPPTKKLKADGMPKCEGCMLSESIGF